LIGYIRYILDARSINRNEKTLEYEYKYVE